jgi:hypothetical protein
MNEMVIRACGRYGRIKKCRISYNYKTNRNYWELGIEGRMIKFI